MRIKHLLIIIALLAFIVPAPIAHAGGVVTVCDEAHLLAALAGGGTVTFACSGTITLTREIAIATDTTIDGSGQEVTISGGDAVRTFYVSEGTAVILNALTISGNSAYEGGRIANRGALTVFDSAFSGNVAADRGNAFHGGGAIYNRAMLSVNNSVISGNSGNQGGGIYNYHADTATVSNSTFSGNMTDDDGGGMINFYGTLTVSNCIFSGNHADAGGGIANDRQSSLSVSDSTFSGNHARYGGGIYNGTDDYPWPLIAVEVTNSTFTGNSAVHVGGGIHIYASRLTLNDSAFSGNDANYGGGIYSNDSQVSVNGSTFSDNNAREHGGGIYSSYRCQVDMSNSTLASNTARAGGGVYSDGAGISMSNCTLAGNSASTTGGSIYSPDSPYVTTVLLRNTIVADSPSGGNCQDGVTDGGGNLSYPDASCPGINADPKLGPLQNNGGPTWTMALGPGSAAIDAADDAICAADPVNNLDQRGVARPQGAHCDIGALEQLRLWLPLMLANNRSPQPSLSTCLLVYLSPIMPP